MPNTLLALYAISIASLFIYSFYWGDNRSIRLWFLRVMMLGMCYDNTIQSIGNWAFNYSWYLPMNYPRWALHVTVLPLLSVFGLSIMRSAGIGIASNRLFKQALWLLAITSIIYGIWVDVLGQQLKAVEVLGVQKYSSALGHPPYATILANIMVIVMSIAVWRISGWAQLFAGSVFIFLVNGGTATQEWGFLSANFAEIIFVAALLSTEKYFRRIDNKTKVEPYTGQD